MRPVDAPIGRPLRPKRQKAEPDGDGEKGDATTIPSSPS
jgi:hypothetical protein